MKLLDTIFEEERDLAERAPARAHVNAQRPRHANRIAKSLAPMVAHVLAAAGTTFEPSSDSRAAIRSEWRRAFIETLVDALKTRTRQLPRKAGAPRGPRALTPEEALAIVLG